MKNSSSVIRSRFTGRMTLGALLVAASLCSGAAHAGVTCPGGDNSPAVPVPECVAADGSAVACSSPGAITLWPDDFRPASGIASQRDSTDRVGGIGVPGAKRGWELFKSVDIVTAADVSRLYVAYNAGIQVWDIDANPANPGRLTFRDGWPPPHGFGNFLSFPPVSEQLAFIEDVAAVNVDAGTDLVAASGKLPVGPSIWQYDTAARSFSQLYQDVGTQTRQVRLAQVADGTWYLFTATDGGVAVYNATAAMNLSTPCLDDEGSVCPSVYRGPIPGIQLGRYIDVIRNPGNNRIYVVTTDGNFVSLEIWELADPDNPAGAVRRFDGASLEDARGPALFSYDDHFYLAVEHFNLLKIFIVDDCLDGGNCSFGAGSVAKAIDSIPLRSSSANTEFVTHSVGSGGTPFLYYGVSVGNLSGSDIDQLFDVSGLRPPDSTPLPKMIELTTGGGAYNDPCNGAAIRYWSRYYPRNSHGLRSMIPRVGKMSPNDYFYRAANSLLDIHVRSASNPAIGIAITSISSGGSTTFVEGQDVPFAATLAGRGPAFWEWRIGGRTQCPGSNPATADLAGTTPQCVWPASQVNPPDPNEIFVDGFESGDVSAWRSSRGASELTAGASTEGDGGGTEVIAELVLWDELTSAANPVATAQWTITVEAGEPQ